MILINTRTILQHWCKMQGILCLVDPPISVPFGYQKIMKVAPFYWTDSCHFFIKKNCKNARCVSYNSHFRINISYLLPFLLSSWKVMLKKANSFDTKKLFFVYLNNKSLLILKLTIYIPGIGWGEEGIKYVFFCMHRKRV